MAGLKTDQQSQWLQLSELLDEGEYTHLAEHLFDFQAAIEQTNDPDLKNLAIAALQICILCQQCQLEIEWHRRADHEVRKRACELEGQLHTLLKLIVEYETLKDTQLPAISVSVTPQQDGDPPETGKHPNLWQRIQDLFNFEPEPPTPGLEPSRLVIDVLFTELVENDKRLGNTDEGNEEVATPDEESEPVTASMAEEDKIPTSAPEEVEPVEEIKAPAFPVPGLERKDTSATPIEKTALGRKKQPSLVVYCLGTFRVYQNDQLITEWQSLKSQAIFKYLLSNSEMPVPKNILMDLFWPDATPKAARRNLHQAIYSLRQLFRGEQKDFQHIRF
ncbi:MAG: hypothetical protein KAS38_22285, partial [Anaerolineales bacterium]|nr:hypothetical protein [Anaerolineales bacterium]